MSRELIVIAAARVAVHFGTVATTASSIAKMISLFQEFFSRIQREKKLTQVGINVRNDALRKEHEYNSVPDPSTQMAVDNGYM
jgi:hypothetical protein